MLFECLNELIYPTHTQPLWTHTPRHHYPVHLYAPICTYLPRKYIVPTCTCSKCHTCICSKCHISARGVILKHVASTRTWGLQVRGAPVWFQSLVWMECSVQVPLSVYLIWAYHAKPPFLRGAALMYSAHVLTTMAPITAHFAATLKDPHIWCVLSIYSPWIIFPGLMFLRFMFFPTMGARRFARKAAAKTKGQ